jgi:hypothetical protein
MLAAPRSDDAARRMLSLALVLVLHALLFFAFLHFMVTPHTAGKAVSERLLEMIISTTRPRTPAPALAPSKSRPALPHRESTPSSTMPSYAPPAAAPDMTGLGQALFGCAPENIPNLTPDQRAHCTNGLTRPDDSLVIEPKSHVQDPVRREAEMRTKNTPGRIPCTSVAKVGALGGSTAAPMVNPLCVLGGLINGFGPLNGLDK